MKSFLESGEIFLRINFLFNNIKMNVTNRTLLQYDITELFKDILLDHDKHKIDQVQEVSPFYFRIFVAIIYSILFIVSIGGNMLIIIIVNGKKLQTVTNFFIISLALSDIIFVIVSIPPTYISYIYDHWIFGKVFKFNLI
jgi:hypothetical protein